ncbi:MAG: DUF4276 family protein [Pseudomonadota bacterium]
MGLSQYATEFVIMLVDSEAPVVPTDGPWQHLERRDRWQRPAAASDDMAHLMVQCMEAWIVADRTTLTEFYAQGFRDSALPARSNVESIPKSELFAALEAATRETKTKGRYRKTWHRFALVGLGSPEALRKGSRHAARFFDVLAARTQPA